MALTKRSKGTLFATWKDIMAMLACLVVFFAALTCCTDATITEWADADTKTVGAGAYTFDVPEGTTTAQQAIKVTATSELQTVTYTLVETTPKTGPFTIGQNSGVLTITTALDYETTKTYTLTITAVDTSETGDEVSATAIVTINVQDVVTFSKDKDSVCVPDRTTAGDEVTTLDIADEVTVGAATYTITGDGYEKFEYTNGKIVVAAGKTITKGDGDPYTLTIKQTDAEGTLTLTVTVGDCSAAPITDAVLKWNNPDQGDSTYTKSIAEGAIAFDEDFAITATPGVVGQAVTYEFVPAHDLFAVHSTAGTITISKALDYETGTSYVLKVKATEKDGDGAATDSSTATVSITVTDVVTFSKLKDTVCVQDGTAADTEVATLPVPDISDTEDDEYSITNGNDKFKIVDDQIKTKTAINKEDGYSYTLTIKATDKPDELELKVTIGDCSTASLLAPLGMLTLLMALFATMN